VQVRWAWLARSGHGKHDGQWFVWSLFTLAEFFDYGGVGRIAHEVIAADAFDSEYLSLAQSHQRTFKCSFSG